MPRRLKRNWITEFHESHSPTTEAPENFLIWAAVSVISAVLKRNVYIDWGAYKIYPNQYIVFVAPPGVGKGEAMHPALDFIRKYKPLLANFITDRVTAPKIIDRLAEGIPQVTILNGAVVTGKDSTAILQSTELSTLLGASDWMTTFLCDMWDRSYFEYDTKNSGTSTITDLCVSLIAACVPDFIRKINGKQSAQDTINGGFTARTLFVYAAGKSKTLPWPIALEKLPGGPEKVQDLRVDLESISKLKGEYTFAAEAVTIWTDWYKKQARLSDDDISDAVRHFRSRQKTHILKVAMCLAASNSDFLIIDKWAITVAIQLVEGVLINLDTVFRGVGESSLAEGTARVSAFIEKKGLCTRAELLKGVSRHLTMEDMDRVIYTLLAMYMIQEYSQGGRQYYKWIGNNNSGPTTGGTP